MTLQNDLRMYAEDMHSCHGHSDCSTVMSLSADRIDEIEKQLAEALRRIPARHAETKVKQVDQIAPTNLPFWGIVETDALSKPCGV